MYAVTGITGQVGGRVAEVLLNAGASVRAIVRDGPRAASWSARGCDVRIADLHDAAALARAFDGTDGVFVLLPPMFDPSPDLREARAAIDALQAALRTTRPAKVVALSTIGARASRPNLLNQLGLLEAALETLPCPVAFLRAAWFLENSAGDVAAARATGTIPAFLQPVERPQPMVATADVGRVAAELLRDTWTGRRIVELEGPVRVAPVDLARSLERLLGRDVVTEAVPRDRWEALFRAQGMRHPLPRMQMLDGFNEGWIAFDESGESQRGVVTIDEVLATLVARAEAGTTPSAA